MTNNEKWRQVCICEYDRLRIQFPTEDLDVLWEKAARIVWERSIAPVVS